MFSDARKQITLPEFRKIHNLLFHATKINTQAMKLRVSMFILTFVNWWNYVNSLHHTSLTHKHSLIVFETEYEENAEFGIVSHVNIMCKKWHKKREPLEKQTVFCCCWVVCWCFYSTFLRQTNSCSRPANKKGKMERLHFTPHTHATMLCTSVLSKHVDRQIGKT